MNEIIMRKFICMLAIFVMAGMNVNAQRVVDGQATYYGSRSHGRKTASGETFNKNEMVCAHRTLPFGTRVRVTNKKNGRSVVVRVIDRGPFGKGKVIDLSPAAARQLDMIKAGVVPVHLEVVGKGGKL